MQKGKNITQNNDVLTAISPEELFEQIKSPAPETSALIARLRLIRSIDTKQYGILKRQLPYIVCGVFNPPYRKSDNFGYCEYFMIDIDHITDKSFTVEALKNRLIQDSRIVMCFISPSEDGLKVLFRLAEKCYDASKYSLFYKWFLTALSQQYALEQVIDVRTSDVSRACFLSHDAEAYFNPAAEKIKMENFVDFDNPFEINKLEKELNDSQASEPINNEPTPLKGPDAEAFAFIKEKLANKKTIARRNTQVYVPEQLNEIIKQLTDYICEAGIVIEEIVDINYGKKFKLRAGLSRSEVNLFFGKKGFSVVVSPRQGASKQLNELMTAYIRAFISDYILLKENLATTYKFQEIRTEIPEYELIKQQAQLLFTEKNHQEALPLYQKLWDNYPEKLDEWDGWRFAYCAKQMKNYSQALDICRSVYLKYRDFKMIRNLYAWSIYYSEINKSKIEDEATFFRASEGILKLSTQDDSYSPYTLTVMKVLDYLNDKTNYRIDKILEWTVKLNPALLDDKAFSFTDKDGKIREIASKREQYYMLRSRALLEKGAFDECIKVCEEALRSLTDFHYDNDVWFRWRIGLSYEGLGEYEKSLNMQLELLNRKKEWFIQKEIAEQYFRLGEYEKSLRYALDSALNTGDANKKINTYICLANVLEKLDKKEEAMLHRTLIEKIEQKSDDFEQELKPLRKIWNSLKYSDKKEYLGIIKSLLPNGKAGFVETENGKSYFFSMRSFKGKPEKAIPGTPVSFYLEEGFDVKKNCKVLNATELKIKR